MKQRTIKELLEVMLQHQDKFRTGLCIWAIELTHARIISSEERIILKMYIDNNKPNMFSSLDRFNQSILNCFIESSNQNFYWEPSKIAPRIKWIKRHIKKLS